MHFSPMTNASIMVANIFQTQLQEALAIFGSLINTRWFNHKAIILFMNKFDLFQRKLSLSPFSHYHTDFPGSDKDFYAAAEYLNRRFLDMDSAQDREIFTHYTTATDTNLLRETMRSVEGIIVLQNLKTLGLAAGIL